MGKLIELKKDRIAQRAKDNKTLKRVGYSWAVNSYMMGELSLFEIEQRLEACPINQQTALEVGAHQALEELRALKITPDTTRRVVTIK